MFDSRSYYRIHTRPLEAPPGLSGPAALRLCASQVARRIYTKPQADLASQALGGPGLEVPAYKVQSISMRSRRLHHGLIRPDPSTLMGCPLAPVSRGAGHVSRGPCPHGLTALGPRGRLPRLSLRPCARACGVARCAPNRLSRVRTYPLPQLSCAGQRRDYTTL